MTAKTLTIETTAAVETNGATFEHYAGGEPCKFADSHGRVLKLYGKLYGPYNFLYNLKKSGR
jgi:hypothetical protein